MVLDYMRQTNRPYSSIDVSTNLKEKVTKPETARVLESLAGGGEVTAKSYGKQTIYVYNQAKLDVLSAGELAELETATKESKAELDARKKKLSTLQQELSSLVAMPTTKDLTRTINRVKAENDKVATALAAYSGESESIAPMTGEEMAAIDRDWIVWRRAWLERRKTYKEAIGLLQETGVIGKLAEWEEEQGIEPDDEESMGVDNGEFTRPPLPARQQLGRAKRAKGATAATATPVTKRARNLPAVM